MLDRWQEYLICKRRGHQPGGTRFMDGTFECKWCGTRYWTETHDMESNAPEPPAPDTKDGTDA